MSRTRVVSFLSLVLISIATSSYALTHAQLWANRWGGTSVDYGNAIATDNLGNVVVTGRFAGTANFGGATLASVFASDDFLVKYSPSGAHMWSESFSGTGNDDAVSVAVDAFGNIFITGHFDDTTNFGGGNLVSAGSLDIFLAKFDANGVHQWSKRFGSNGGPTGNDYGTSVAVDGSGSVFMTGVFSGTVDFGGGGLTSGGGYDIFLAKYDANGVHQWSKRFGSANLVDDQGNSVSVDVIGNVIVAGSFGSIIDFGGGALASNGGTDVFMAKYDTNGAHFYSRQFGGSGSDAAVSVANDIDGNTVLTGRFQNTVTFGGGDMLTSVGSNDIFLAKFDFTSAYLWSKRFGNTGIDVGACVSIDASRNIALTGTFNGTVDFGGGGLASAGNTDAVLAMYNKDGAHLWSRHFGGVSADDGSSVAFDGSGNLYASGDFSGSADFDGTNLISNSGSVDFYLTRYGWREPIITSVSDIGNDQGHMAKVSFRGSGYDDAVAATPIAYYLTFRRDDPPPAVSTRGLAPLPGNQVRANTWTLVGYTPATGASSYSVNVPTVGDSTIALGLYFSVFYVSAATTAPSFFDSAPDSGWSVDNLAPGTPQNVGYEAGLLSWDASVDADFDHYSVYGASTNSFGAGIFINDTTTPSMDVSGSLYPFFFVTATDVSGNESNPGNVNGPTAVGDTPASYVLSVSNYPNPFNPRTTVKYTVPSQGRVTIAVYDASGARVAKLFAGERAAGAYDVQWDGRADTGSAVSSGVYFARIEHTSGGRTKKMVLLK